jgi:membrane-bound acyltransferase YfiQ involved in biofilm formation
MSGGEQAHRPSEERSEEEQERLNRQMLELLNELRVAMPGVQVLFGFLLTVPFQQGWRRVTEFQENVYFVTLIAAAVATAFLIAPSAYHRVAFEKNEKPNIVRIGTVEMLAGLVALAVAMNGAVLLVTDLVFDSGTTASTIVVLAMLYTTLWFGLGIVRRLQK